MTAVNFGELKVSQNPAETLVAFSIGSGIGVSIYDPISRAGGLLNFVLPDASMMSPSQTQFQPFLFADSGLAAFWDALHDIGAQTVRLKVVLVGGAQIMDQSAAFNIGLKNYQAVTSFLAHKKIAIHYADIGNNFLRTLRLDIVNGDNCIQTLGLTEVTV
jgi:chemotaxis protein CheD